jgi:predicted nucleic acid-binding Zn ribbon protein
LKHSNDQSIGSAIKEFLRAYHLEEKYNQTQLVHSWENVVGKMVAKHTKEIFVRNKTLFVRIDSSALRNELCYSREKIMKSLNNEVNAEVIDDIVFK